MDARDEDFLAADVGGLDGQVLVLTCGYERKYVNDAEESKEEKGCPKDSGPRGSREAAKREAYHDRVRGLEAASLAKSPTYTQLSTTAR